MPATEHIKTLLNNLPQKVGVYRYYDKNEKLLYIGKAKNLKKRVTAYFTKNQESGKIKVWKQFLKICFLLKILVMIMY